MIPKVNAKQIKLKKSKEKELSDYQKYTFAQRKSKENINEKMGDTTELSDYYNLKDLPGEIREKLAELELELSEGRC